MSAIGIIGFIGILLIIGFIADYLFHKISLPDILILLVLGYLIGPVFNIVNPADIAPASQIISSLALAVILFNGGMSLEFAHIKSSAPRAVGLVFLGIAFSMAATVGFAHYLMNWDILNSLLLGAIVGGSSPSIIMPLVNRAKVSTEVSSVLSLESAFNGALVIVIAVIILKVIISGTTEGAATTVGLSILTRVLIGGSIGAAAGILWLWILSLLEGETYDDILTLAIVFLLYFAVESIEGSGVIFALIFGLILGNGIVIAKFLRISRAIEVHDLMRKFHAQMSFLIKTFFFIYLGLVATFDDPAIILLGVVLCLVLLVVRYLAVVLSSIGNRTLLASKGILTTMYARGLSAAVVAEIVVISGIPNASIYPDIIIVVIVATIVISSLGIIIFARKKPPGEVAAGDIKVPEETILG
jgi:cell volume regulation protein A